MLFFSSTVQVYFSSSSSVPGIKLSGITSTPEGVLVSGAVMVTSLSGDE